MSSLHDHPDNYETGTFATPIPDAVLYDRRISEGAVRVYATLVRHGVDLSSPDPTLNRLAHLLGKSADTIRRWMAELETAGWVESFSRFSGCRGQISNGYRVHYTAINQQEVAR